MATLHVRKVPDDLYRRLRKRAEERGTSISAETIRLLYSALRPETADVRRFLREVERKPLRPAPGSSPPAELIRRDRDAR